jgi:predicted transcriptional regulator
MTTKQKALVTAIGSKKQATTKLVEAGHAKNVITALVKDGVAARETTKGAEYVTLTDEGKSKLAAIQEEAKLAKKAAKKTAKKA